MISLQSLIRATSRVSGQRYRQSREVLTRYEAWRLESGGYKNLFLNIPKPLNFNLFALNAACRLALEAKELGHFNSIFKVPKEYFTRHMSAFLFKNAQCRHDLPNHLSMVRGSEALPRNLAVLRSCSIRFFA